MVSLNNLLGITLEEEVSLNHATSSDVAEGACSILVIFNNGGLGISVFEVHTEEFALIFALDQDEGMDTIDLKATSAVIVGTVLSLSPHSPCAFTKSEFVDSLTETKESLGRKL